jgi:hypothetical protein
MPLAEVGGAPPPATASAEGAQFNGRPSPPRRGLSNLKHE